MAAEKKMRPWLAYHRMISGGPADNDWRQALWYATFLNPFEPVETIKPHLRSTRKWVDTEWQTIVCIGDGLLASHGRSVSGEAVAALM